ncbi:MAG: glucose-6-phosphate isomerase family protein, partial [Methanoregula sp.]|nr:glucose-6-phosphate isomerase family protein [Methanoregula sp.]
PGYGHVTLNPSHDTTLAMANLVSTAFASEYGEYETLHGAAYYVMSDGRIIKNPHYPDVPVLRKIAIRKGPASASGSIKSPIYTLVGNSEALAFLNEPEKYPALFP